MIAFFRRFLNTWAARAFFLVLLASFVVWGVGDVVRSMGSDSDGAVATVGSRKIQPQELDQAFRNNLAQYARLLGNRIDPTPQMRRGLAEQTLTQLVTQAALDQEAQSLGLTVTDDALRQAVLEDPAFRTPAGFSRARYDALMRSGRATEARYLDQLRSGYALRQLVGSVRAGATAPDVLVRAVYAYQMERRVAEYVELPFAAADDPPAPSEDDLRRQYDNDPAAYAAPEYRHVKAVVLSAETIARGTDVPEDELRAYYDAHKAEFTSAEKRSVEVVISQDEAVARRLAEQWMAGADWDAMQAAATAAGSAATVLEDTGAGEFPDPELGRAVFAATPEAVSGPVHGTLGWQVLRVTGVRAGGSRTFEEARDEVRGRVAQERAADRLYPNAQQVEDLLVGGTKLEDLPGDLGLAAVSGTLDAQGNTPEDEPAPIPGGPQLRQALVAAAFRAAKGAPPVFTEAPDGSWFALEVDEVMPGDRKPFDAVKDAVREDWLRAARRREQEVVAAKLLAAVKGGMSLQDAATVSAVRVGRTPPVQRTTPVPALPPQANDVLFRLQPGEPTMVEGPQGFVVLVLADKQVPGPEADPAGYGEARAATAQSVGNDVEQVFTAAVRDGLGPRVNRAALDGVVER